MFRTYKFRMYPDSEQQELLAERFRASSFVSNHFLALSNGRHAKAGKGMTYRKMSSVLTSMKASDEYSLLKETNSRILQQTLMHLDTTRGFSRILPNTRISGKGRQTIIHSVSAFSYRK